MNNAQNHGDDSAKGYINKPNHSNSSQSNTPKITPVIFEGSAREYFGIWIVNLLLSIVTFGIYSAWAKVRRKKYFYNNTLIENVGFDYHAKPWSILKGRLIAVALIAVSAINPILQSLVLLLLFLALPWLVVRGSIFNARNSSHRGLRFDFVGTFGKAIRVFIGLPLLTMISLGLAAPYAAHEKNQFLVNNHKFGLSQFEMKRVVGKFYKVYMILIILPLIGILAAISIPAYQTYVNKAKAVKTSDSSQVQFEFDNNIVAFAPIAAFDNQIKNKQAKLVLAASEVEAAQENTTNEIEQVKRVYSENDLLPIEELPAQTVEQQLKKIEEKMDEIEYEQDGEPATDITQQQDEIETQAKTPEQQMLELVKNPGMLLAMLGVMIAYLLFIFGFLGYLQARIGNLVWNSTTLDKFSFKSTLRARDFAWLYFSNIVAIMFTFGLATPWAQIRLARYRATKLNIVGDVDFDQFVGDKKAEVKATGEEIAEMFDVDLSFG